MYLVLITLLGAVGITLSLVPVFATPRFRLARTCLLLFNVQLNLTVFFVGFGCFAIFPVPHLWITNGWGNFWPIMLLELAMGSLYIIGCVFYATRIPERYFPGKFDFSVIIKLATINYIQICSHVIWHFFTIAAALLQLYICIVCYTVRRANPCPT